jgi:RimJ/RimL family protein N-acetyltransferase
MSATGPVGLRPTTDGVVTIRPPGPGDAAVLVAGRDATFHRFLGPGDPDPRPLACVVVAGETVGWVDHDAERAWLEPGQVNLGYCLFAAHRGRGYASRAVQLLVHHLAVDTAVRNATLLIHPDNAPSLELAGRLGFDPAGTVDGSRYWKRAVPPITYTDGVVTIRRQRPADLDADLTAKDDDQIDWLWLPGQRGQWQAMTTAEQRAHARRGLAANRAAFGTGPKWIFAVDGPDADYVAYVDSDLANDHVPHGEANVSFSGHPEHRGRGYVSRAVRLVCQFLRDHTGARQAHLVIDERNEASIRVAAAVGAAPEDGWVDELGNPMRRFVRPL